MRLERIGPRIAAGLLVLGGMTIVLVLFHRGQLDPVAIKDAVAGSFAAPAIFVGLQILASLLFVPRTVLGIAAGLIFGFAWGAFWANLGAVAGAAAGFALWRWIGAGEVDIEATPRLGPLIQRAESGGWRAVAIVRLMPALPHSLANMGLALTKVGWRDYLLGSFVGMLPMTLVQVDIGAAGGTALAGHRGWIWGSLLLALGLGASFVIRRAGNRRE